MHVDIVIHRDCIIGAEFSGRMENGQRIMGLVPAKGFATTVATDPNLLLEVPDDWSLEEASTVPMAYFTAYYALIIKGNLRKSERVLIHSGSGSVGQAAIAIALALGCEVFTTVSSAEKKEFLKNRFKELQDRNFCHSRDTSFEYYILTATNGKGVDVILNSLAEEKFKATLNCLSESGTFLEIGKYDMANNTPLGMSIFLKNISFVGIMLDNLLEDNKRYHQVRNEIVRLIKDGIANGTVRPLRSTLFDSHQAEEAFRFMANGKHIGKVVLRIKEEEAQKKIVTPLVHLEALSRTTCNPEKSYIIIGGLGGFGLELCQWLVDRGALHVVLTSRSGIKTGYQKLCVNRWKQDKINIIVSELNVVKMEEAEALLKMTAKVRPIAAIFNLALVLADAVMENQTVNKFVEVCEPKATSTMNLDAASRVLCLELEWFVCFSSRSSGIGNAGQSNYSYANSAMERICEKRMEEGLPGLAIQWGIVGDVGIFQDKVGSDDPVAGTVSQTISSCLTVLDKFLQQCIPVVSSFVPYQTSESTARKDLKQNILYAIGNIFGIKDISAINPESSLGQLGMDSLSGLEIQQTLERDFDLVLTIPELRKVKVKDLKKLEKLDDETKTTSNPKSSYKLSTDSTTELDEKSDVRISEHLANIPSNSLVPIETIIHMNSVTNGIPIFIVHPMEGIVLRLNSLAHLVSFPVYGIQSTSESPSESIEQLAVWYWKHIKALNIGSTICLAGLSFGGTIAIEMSLQAERDPQQHPTVQSLVMLDASPAFMIEFARKYRSQFHIDNKVEFEAQALGLYASMFIDINIMEFKEELRNLPTFGDRIKKSVEKIFTICNNLQTKDLSLAFNLYYKKLLISLKYNPERQIKKDVTLIKASSSIYAEKNFSKNYELEKFCTGKITVHTVKGTHTTFIQGEGAKEVSSILNDMFSHTV